MCEKHRQEVGVDRYNAKLTDDAVRQIRAATEPVLYLAKRFGVSKGLISNVRNMKRWRHVPQLPTGTSAPKPAAPGAAPQGPPGQAL